MLVQKRLLGLASSIILASGALLVVSPASTAAPATRHTSVTHVASTKIPVVATGGKNKVVFKSNLKYDVALCIIQKGCSPQSKHFPVLKAGKKLTVRSKVNLTWTAYKMVHGKPVGQPVAGDTTAVK